MESLHLSFSRAVEAGIFTGIKIDSSLTLSHLFYADDVVFIGEWSNGPIPVPKQVLNSMERMRMNFFNGVQEGERKIAWVKWSKVLASKKFGGLSVSMFFALNRALIFKW
nr:RNA-directed DNA polymerase, eukaryota, reverse transcriptase zinc-binding domain protein [Tanacetum cinerariifolium]